ncbi:MAG: hypothetical protein PVH19_09470, partial [Planctomycetia bacterium]
YEIQETEEFIRLQNTSLAVNISVLPKLCESGIIVTDYNLVPSEVPKKSDVTAKYRITPFGIHVRNFLRAKKQSKVQFSIGKPKQ